MGETLTAETSGIADDDGLDNVSFSYQWQADDVDLPGATSSTYTLADSDDDKAISVKVSFTDDAGNAETLTSAATAAVEARLLPPLTAVIEKRRYVTWRPPVSSPSSCGSARSSVSATRPFGTMPPR